MECRGFMVGRRERPVVTAQCFPTAQAEPSPSLSSILRPTSLVLTVCSMPFSCVVCLKRSKCMPGERTIATNTV